MLLTYHRAVSLPCIPNPLPHAWKGGRNARLVTFSNLVCAQVCNDTASDVVYLEIGDRTPGDAASYPDDDLQAVMVDGKWQFTHKDGTPYS